MENGDPVFKCADIAEDVLQNLTDFKGILSHPVCCMSIGSDGDDLSAQFLEPPEVIRGGQKTAAAVHAAGVQLHALAAPDQLGHGKSRP